LVSLLTAVVVVASSCSARASASSMLSEAR
jgi:hypothetical protein